MGVQSRLTPKPRTAACTRLDSRSEMVSGQKGLGAQVLLGGEEGQLRWPWGQGQGLSCDILNSPSAALRPRSSFQPEAGNDVGLELRQRRAEIKTTRWRAEVMKKWS